MDSKQRITVRNLRIREDTAKYLRNLDPNSAYYDPKTRSMRDNPNPNVNEWVTAFFFFIYFENGCAVNLILLLIPVQNKLQSENMIYFKIIFYELFIEHVIFY